MNIEQVRELLEEIAPEDDKEHRWIDCGESTGYIDDNQYERIVAALNQNIELQEMNKSLKSNEEEMMLNLENLKKRLKHLFLSETIADYDFINPKTKSYLHDINEVDSFFATGYRLLLEYANKNNLDRVDDFRIEKQKNEGMNESKIIYDPILSKTINLELHIVNNTTDELCPICNKELGQYPAISRKDNKTKVCSECGTLEALKAWEESLNAKEENI